MIGNTETCIREVAMFDVFTTREIATGIYFLLFSAIFSFIPDVREGFGKVLKTALIIDIIRHTQRQKSEGEE